jgi:hypothetical protein
MTVLQRPMEAIMLFSDGGCDRSNHRQERQSTCEDGVNGISPPTEPMEQVHILVTDTKGLGIVYFVGLVSVGEPFERYQMITISTPDQSAVLQKVRYDSSGSSYPELKNRFGASQLVGFYTDQQGNVTCFQSVELSVNVSLPALAAAKESITLTNLSATTNFAGEIDWTFQVAGEVIEAGRPVRVNLSATLDLSVRRRYIAALTMKAVRQSSDSPCEGMQVLSFEGGIRSSSSVSTGAPTIAPSASTAPSPDVLTSACSIEALVICELVRNEGTVVVGDCDDIKDPRGVACAPNTRATVLSFKYLANFTDVLPRNNTIIAEYRDSVQETFPIGVGQLFTVKGDFRGSSVRLAMIDGVFDNEIVVVETACGSGGELALGTMYGPFELVGYENQFGIFTSIYEVRVTYIVKNGPLEAILEGAVVYSAFVPEPLMLVEAGSTALNRGGQLTLYQKTTVVNSTEKFAQDLTFSFSLNVTARAKTSAATCVATYTYQI